MDPGVKSAAMLAAIAAQANQVNAEIQDVLAAAVASAETFCNASNGDLVALLKAGVVAAAEAEATGTTVDDAVGKAYKSSGHPSRRELALHRAVHVSAARGDAALTAFMHGAKAASQLSEGDAALTMVLVVASAAESGCPVLKVVDVVQVAVESVPAQPTESAAGSPIGTVSALFLALTVVGVFVLPFKSAFSNPECNEYEEALRWLFASLLAGMLTVFATLKLAHIAPRVGHPESKVKGLSKKLTFWSLLLFAAEAAFAVAAASRYRDALVDCQGSA